MYTRTMREATESTRVRTRKTNKCRLSWLNWLSDCEDRDGPWWNNGVDLRLEKE